MDHTTNETNDQAPEESTQTRPPVPVEDEVVSLRAHLEEQKNLYLRSLADLDNLRKRAEREKQDMRKYAIESFLKDFVSVLDSIDQALVSQGAKESELFKGVELVQRKILEMLAKNGLTVLETVGKKFDPHLHQAIQKVEKENLTEELVEQEFVKGYLLGDRLIRPAMVCVSVPKDQVAPT